VSLYTQRTVVSSDVTLYPGRRATLRALLTLPLIGERSGFLQGAGLGMIPQSMMLPRLCVSFQLFSFAFDIAIDDTTKHRTVSRLIQQSILVALLSFMKISDVGCDEQFPFGCDLSESGRR